MSKILSILSILTAIFLLSCGESSEKYNKRAFNFSDSTIFYTDVNFELASDLARSWRSIIYDSKYLSPVFNTSKYCSDFNEGLKIFSKDLENFPSVKERKNYVDSVFNLIKDAPSKSEGVFNDMKELYSIYIQSFEMVYNPEGSLQSYTGAYNSLYTKYKELKSKIEISKKVN